MKHICISVRDQGPCQYSHRCHIDQHGVSSLSTPLSTASKTRTFFPSWWCKSCIAHSNCRCLLFLHISCSLDKPYRLCNLYFQELAQNGRCSSGVSRANLCTT
uniref:Uncharacterized protein n=1 Tax=Anguilla anguilla TaxID=7936 RepID=A0A0E9TQU0_ANGAN